MMRDVSATNDVYKALRVGRVLIRLAVFNDVCYGAL